MSTFVRDRDYISPGFKLTYRPGDPYDFWITACCDGMTLDIEHLSMGDMVDLNRRIAHLISEARKAKRHVDEEYGR